MNTLDQVKAALAEPGTPFASVSGAAGLAGARNSGGPKSLPAAYVFFGKEASAEGDRDTGPVLQLQERDLSVVIVIDNASDAAGDASADELETVKAWVRGQLIGLVQSQPDKAPITHIEGAIADFENGRVWFEDVFSAPTYLEET